MSKKNKGRAHPSDEKIRAARSRITGKKNPRGLVRLARHIFCIPCTARFGVEDSTFSVLQLFCPGSHPCPRCRSTDTCVEVLEIRTPKNRPVG